MENREAARFFLDAYSSGGYCSLYESIDPDKVNRVYILKGGPGSGKHEYLRCASDCLSQKKIQAQEILCPLDTACLDGVVFPSIGAAFLDGCDPHVLEPKYPDLIERYVVLRPKCGCEEKRAEIVKLTCEYREWIARAYRCLAAARSLYDDIFSLVIPGAALESIAKRARGVIEREIKPAGQEGKLYKRFLSAVTPDGPVCLFKTARLLCERIYEVNDDYGLSHFFLSPILSAALKAGLEVYACYCPLNPENKLEHVLIPSLSLGFVTSGSLYPYDGEPYRRVRLNIAIDKGLLKRFRQRLRFGKKTAQSLLSEASASLKQARGIGCALERIFNPDGDNGQAVSRACADIDEILCSAQGAS